MDRFIVMPDSSSVKTVWNFKIQYGQIYSRRELQEIHRNLPLKSNMDRFIAIVLPTTKLEYASLKSNMDRFIAAGNKKRNRKK